MKSIICCDELIGHPDADTHDQRLEVIEAAAQLKQAKQARTESDREVADLQVRKHALEQKLQTALVEQERNRNEENYLAGELAWACRSWLDKKQPDSTLTQT